MALTQETILKFLVERGGKAKNSDLLNTFKNIINCSDATEKKQNRELFKIFVNNVAVVKEIEGVKYVVIKKKYQHLVNVDIAVTPQNLELGESSDCSNILSTPGSTSELRGSSYGEMGKIFHNDLDNNNVPIVSNTSDDCLNANVSNLASELSSQRGFSSPVEGKTGAVFAIVAVKTQSRVQGDELVDKQDGSSIQLLKQRTPESSQKPHMLPLRIPSTQLSTEPTADDCKENIVKVASELDPYRSPITKRRQVEENVVPSSPNLRRGYKTAKPGEEPKCSENIPLERAEHEWLVNAAAGHWTQVYGLLLEDSQLAEKKDFISGFTALHWAAKSGKSEMVCKIIEIARQAGTEIDINAKTHGGYTPLHIAAMHDQPSVMALLVQDYGANTNIRDNSGKKPYHYLAQGVLSEVREMLGDPQVLQETHNERNEDDNFPELPKGFNTLSRLFQPYVGHKKKPRRPVFSSISEYMEDENDEKTFKRRPFSDMFL